jgi:transcriptional regulator with XRE-family HTH domain
VRTAENTDVAEHLGTLLWEMRTGRGLSLGQLAKQAGISKAALSRWEAGTRQPRVPELDAVLAAMGASAAQHARAFACIAAPRALRRLNAPAQQIAGMGAPPSAGDLLRAMRLRGGLSQEQIAVRIGVRQHTVARWELGERLPSSEEMQVLCFALDAREEELIALTTGRFSEQSAPIAADADAVQQEVDELMFAPEPALEDLRFLTLEHALWVEAAQHERVRPILANVHAYHAHYLSNHGRWQEAGAQAQRALELTARQEHEPEWVLRAALKLAAATVYGGHHSAPERGISLLTRWLPHSQSPNFTAWILSDIALYAGLSGQTERGVMIAKQAVAIPEVEWQMRRLDLSRALIADGRSGEALDNLPNLDDEARGARVYSLLIETEAHLLLGFAHRAHESLQQAYRLINLHGPRVRREQADRLARRIDLAQGSIFQTKAG